MSYLEMEGKRVVVSGAANGIGAAIFHELLENDAFPVGIDLEKYEGSELQRRLGNLLNSGKEFNFIQGNASDPKTVNEVTKLAEIFYGLVNNAGLLGKDYTFEGVRTVESLHKMMEGHVDAPLRLIEAVHPKMIEGGSIVNIGSIDVDMAAPNQILYATAKGALRSMTVAYAVQLGRNGIRVNMVSPGNVNTPRNMEQYDAAAALISGFEGKTPLQRSAQPEEIVNSVMFLLSPRSSATTGANLVVDCGYSKALWDPSWTVNTPNDLYNAGQ